MRTETLASCSLRNRPIVLGIELLALLFAFAVPAPGADDSRREPSTELVRGIELYWSGMYEETIEVLSPTCESGMREDERVECFKYLGFSRVAVGDGRGALDTFGSLLRIDANYALYETMVAPKILRQFVAAREELTTILFEEGKAAYFDERYEEAKDVLTTVVTLDPEHVLAKEYSQLTSERIALARAPSSSRSEASQGRAEPGAEAALDDEDRVYHLTSRMVAPVLVSQTPPDYPPSARRARREGTVVVTAVVSQDGSVRSARIVRSASRDLDQAALQAVKRWQYRPASLEGRPIAVYVVVKLEFDLG